MSFSALVCEKNSNMYKAAEKLHKQFGHPKASKLIDLVNKTGKSNSKLISAINQVSSKCSICLKFQKAPNRPVVAMPIASKFNDVVSTDLKVWGSKYLLVLIDVATRYCISVVICNKNPSTVVSKIILHWISIFGSPKTILSDNGGEYNNELFRCFGESFNITIKTTAAQSPWSNGYCERQNATLGNLVRKILADSNCSLEVAVAWAVAARNSLSNISGFSPNQLVFGRNPALPNVFENKLPALNSSCPSDLIRENLNAMHSARQEFVKFESNEKVTRALRHNTRSTQSYLIKTGDKVYYKRNENHEWHGPAVVIGRDGKMFMLRHGGILVRVHECRLCEAIDDIKEIMNEDPIPSMTTDNSSSKFDEMSDCCFEDRVPTEVEDRPEVSVPGLYQDRDAGIRGSDGQNKGTSIKPGERISGKFNDGGSFVGRVHSRAGKATSKYRNCFNIELTDGTVQCIDLFKDLDEYSVIPDEAEIVVMYTSEKVQQSKEDEIRSWQSNEVYTEVEDIGQQSMSVRWVTTEKIKNGKPVVKSRLVARGFEENSTDLHKHSPTCSKEAVRLTLSVASAHEWRCNSIDVKTAYLQGKPIEREVFLRPPPEFDEGQLWKLNKTVYGLSDAARQWYLRLKEELLNLGMLISPLDPALFSWRKDGSMKGILCLYVDDILWSGEASFKLEVIDKLSDMFTISNSSSKVFKYIGLNIENPDDGTSSIDQCDYITTVRPIPLSKARMNNKHSELTEKEKGEYRSLVGQLNWIATQTRPDIAFDVCDHSSKFKNATVADICSLNKVVSRLHSTSLKLHYPVMPSFSNCFLECFTDASFANLHDSSSQGGFIIFLSSTEGKRCPIYWESRKIRRVVKSTLAAETLALIDGAETAVYIGKLIHELSDEANIPIICYTDNKSLVDVLDSTKNVDDRRLRIDVALLRDMLQRKDISSIRWVSTANQLANSLTKRGASAAQLRAAFSRE